MSHESCDQFLAAFRADHKSNSYASKRDIERFAEFACQLPPAERIPLLLHAYDRYRSLALCGDPNDGEAVEASFYSILISTILSSGIQPDRREAVEILRRSYHRCGHGSDVEPPLILAERAFHGQPYSAELFDGVRAYRETLRISRGSHAANIKRQLGWILWHDQHRVEKKCHTRRIQQAIPRMDAKSAFHWQWLLRNISGGFQAAPGKVWTKDGRKRLAKIGEEEFYTKLDDWFTFPEAEVNLSAAGSVILRLLVWYGALVDVERSLPVLVRLVHAGWSKNAPVGKVMSALAWVLRIHGKLKFEAEARVICHRFACESTEVKRLEERYFPEESQMRKQADLDGREQMANERHAQTEAVLRTLQENNPQMFGPDGPVARFRERVAAKLKPVA